MTECNVMRWLNVTWNSLQHGLHPQFGWWASGSCWYSRKVTLPPSYSTVHCTLYIHQWSTFWTFMVHTGLMHLAPPSYSPEQWFWQHEQSPVQWSAFCSCNVSPCKLFDPSFLVCAPLLVFVFVFVYAFVFVFVIVSSCKRKNYATQVLWRVPGRAWNNPLLSFKRSTLAGKSIVANFCNHL